MSETLASVRERLVDVVALIDGEPEAPPSPAPAPEPRYFTIPLCYPLFGPVQLSGALQQIPGPSFAWQGDAMTASSKQLYLGSDVADVDVARAVAVWAPGSSSNEIEIVKFDNGPANIERIALIPGQNLATPTGSGVIITDGLQAMVDNARANGTPYKHLGFRMRGPAMYTLYEVRIEVSWKVRLA